ncbi:MAG: NAD(P)-dependent oxidoreductase, partial [Prevotellaceae bacterium]|nr:NAD(P)-dependent oxidoreductase [Prevotellaceae bacterium]
MRIVILDGYGVNPGDLSWDFLNEYGDVEVYAHEITEKTVERLADADIAITNKVVIDRDIIAQLPKLKLIIVAATGYNVVDVDAAREHGVLVANIPAYSTDSVAQMVFAHILNITNRVQHYADENRNGRWCKSRDFCYYDYATHELAGMTIGIIGVGNIGTKVAAIANCFGMRVIAMTHRSQDDLPAGIQKVCLDELLKEADFITLHCPLSEKTREIISK